MLKIISSLISRYIYRQKEESIIVHEYQDMTIGAKGLDLIKRYEGFRSAPYLCPAKVATIGYGTTRYSDGRKVTLNDRPISEREAHMLLEHQVNITYAPAVNKSVTTQLTQNQFDALVSFVYNLGEGNFRRSTLLKKINSGDFVGASHEFKRWNKAGGRVLKGLIARRESEIRLFLS